MPSQQHVNLLASLATSRRLWVDASDATTYSTVQNGPDGQPQSVVYLSDKDQFAVFAFEQTSNTTSVGFDQNPIPIAKAYDSSPYYLRPNLLDTTQTYGLCSEYVVSDASSVNGHYDWTVLCALVNRKISSNTTQPYAVWLVGHNPGSDSGSAVTDSFRPSYFPGGNLTKGLVALIDPVTDRFELFLVTPGYDGTTNLDGVVPLTRPSNGAVFRDLTDATTIISVKSTKNYDTDDAEFVVHLNGELYSKATLVQTDSGLRTYDITTSLYAPSGTDELGNPINYTAYETQTISRTAIRLDYFRITCFGAPMLYGNYGGTYLYGQPNPGGNAYPATYSDTPKTASDRPIGAGYLGELQLYSTAVMDSGIKLLHNYLREKWIVPQSSPVVATMVTPVEVFVGGPIQIEVEVRTTAREAASSSWGVNQLASDSISLIGLKVEFDQNGTITTLPLQDWQIQLISSNYPTAPATETISVFRISGVAPDQTGTVQVSFTAKNTDSSLYRQWDSKGYVTTEAQTSAVVPPTPVVSELTSASAQAGTQFTSLFTATDTSGVSISKQNPQAPTFQVSANPTLPDSFVLSGGTPTTVGRFEVTVEVKLLNE